MFSQLRTVKIEVWPCETHLKMQKEYAALDAAVLVHIFHHVRGQPYCGGKEEQCKVEWKSHIVSGKNLPYRFQDSAKLLIVSLLIFRPKHSTTVQVSRMSNTRRTKAS